MLEKILVPLDGSELSHGILTFVRRLVAPGTTEIDLVRVVTREDTEDLTEGEAKALARAHLARVASILARSDLKTRCTILEGDAARAILAHAEKHPPSLIALATHGRSGIARWALGSVAERLLRASPFPLLLASTTGVASLPWWGAPQGSEDLEREVGFRRILVPVDGSEASNAVLPLVAEIARLHDSEVTLLHVARRGRKASLDAAERALAGVKHSLQVVEGKPAPCIVDCAAEGLYDLVALTTHGEGGVSPWPFGATAEHVLRACSAPLLVQPSANRAARATPKKEALRLR